MSQHKTETTDASDAPQQPSTPVQSLTAADRCDRCGAQAYVRLELPSGLELLFCAHDWRKHEDATPSGTQVTDETARLR